MPNGSSLKTRLTLLNTVVLVLILGVGGFFLYSSQRQQLLDQLDAELLSIAREVSCAQQGSELKAFRHQPICQSFDQVAQFRTDKFAAILFTSQAKQLCSNKVPLSNLLQFSATEKTSFKPGPFHFDIVKANNGESLRRLLFPITIDGEKHLQLQIGVSLEKTDEASQFFALLLFFSGLAAIICFATCHWLLFSLLTTPLTRLIHLMAGTNEENVPQPFQVPDICGRELQQLSEGYNALTEHLALSLRKAQQFSADVTHELRTPLTILRGETELALRGDKDKEQLQQILCSNLEEISRMGHLIEDLLLLSKSELGEVPLKMEAIDLGSLLDELYFQAKIIAEEKQISVHMQRSDEQISLFADALRLRQVFLNLLTNAIKYTPEGGSVTINWSLQKDFARIIIEDTGIGIDCKHQEHIFDRFYRIDKTRNRHDGGSGLGLAIVKWMVAAHQGSIRVCSEPGKGSCFTVMLPLTHMQSSPPDKN